LYFIWSKYGQTQHVMLYLHKTQHVMLYFVKTSSFFISPWRFGTT